MEVGGVCIAGGVGWTGGAFGAPKIAVKPSLRCRAAGAGGATAGSAVNGLGDACRSGMRRNSSVNAPGAFAGCGVVKFGSVVGAVDDGGSFENMAVNEPAGGFLGAGFVNWACGTPPISFASALAAAPPNNCVNPPGEPGGSLEPNAGAGAGAAKGDGVGSGEAGLDLLAPKNAVNPPACGGAAGGAGSIRGANSGLGSGVRDADDPTLKNAVKLSIGFLAAGADSTGVGGGELGAAEFTEESTTADGVSAKSFVNETAGSAEADGRGCEGIAELSGHAGLSIVAAAKASSFGA